MIDNIRPLLAPDNGGHAGTNAGADTEVLTPGIGTSPDGVASGIAEAAQNTPDDHDRVTSTSSGASGTATDAGTAGSSGVMGGVGGGTDLGGGTAGGSPVGGGADNGTLTDLGGGERLHLAAHPQLPLTGDAHVAHPLRLTAWRHQVLLPLEREQVDRRRSPLAALAALDPQLP